MVLIDQLDLEFEPGSKWEYSNYGFLLLGVLIEKSFITPDAYPLSVNAITTGFEANQANVYIGDKAMEDSDGIGSSSDTGKNCSWKFSGQRQYLFARFFTDNFMEVANHGREWVRTGNCAEHVVRSFNIGHPITHRFIDRIL